MIEFNFKGLCVPVFTAFDENLSVNVDIIPQYAKFLADKGIDGILVHGSKGEGMSLSVAERKKNAEHWAKVVKTTKQHLMVQVAGCPLPDVIELAKHAESIGADSILSLPELYFKPESPLAVINYLKHIGKAAPKTPLLYYHNPALSNVNVNVAELMELASEHLPTFVGIKYTSSDLDGGMAALRANNGKYKVFLGSDTLMLGAYAMGFDSAMASSMNFLSEYGMGIAKAIKENNVQEAFRLQEIVSAAIGVITKHGGKGAAMKVAMTLTTPINVGLCRPPLTNLTPKEIEKMKDSLEGLRIIR